jgi:hypothetical protein
MAFPDFTKDSHEVLDYRVDWSEWLDADTISTSTWHVPDGITQDAENETTTTATIWLSGGTTGENYNVTNHITTAGGRTGERTITIKVRDR